MLVSVITPTYNRAALLEETIESVLAQDYPHIDYMVLDDGSTDGTQELLARYKDRLTVEYHSNMGETRTVNHGFAMARGDIVGVINSDDPLLPCAIRRVVQAFEAHPDAVAVYPDWAEIDERHRFLAVRRLPLYDLSSMLSGLSWGLGPGTFFRRETVAALGGRNTALVYCGDMEFWLRLAAMGPMVHIPRVLATHRVHSGSLSVSQRGAPLAREWISVFRSTLRQPSMPEPVRWHRHHILSQVYHIAARYYCGPRGFLLKIRLLMAAACLKALHGSRQSGLRLLRPPAILAARAVFRMMVRFQQRRLGISPTTTVRESRSCSRFAFSTRFVPPMWSGQAVVIGRLLEGLAPEVYRLVRLPVPSASGAQAFIRTLPGKCFDLPPERTVSGTRFFEWIRIINLFLGTLQRGPAIAQALKDEGIDTLIGCSGDVVDPPAAFFAARILGCRFFVYYFDDYCEQWWAEPRLRAVVQRFERMISVAADGLISPNEFMQLELKRRHGRDSSIVRNPCPWEKGYAPKPPYINRRDTLNLVFTGAVYHLNYDVFRTLLAALGSLARPGIRLHIYTAQPAEELARQGLAGPHLEVHPHVPPHEALTVQRNADILVIPFSFAENAAGIVKRSATAKLSDYLMAGRPILAICPNDSFLGWYLSTHRCGVVVPRDDVGLIAVSIENLIRDAAFREELGRNAQDRARSDFHPRDAQRELLHAIGFRGDPHSARKKIPDPLSIVQVSGYDTIGIQVNGFLLHKYLEEKGHSSKMLVYKKVSDDPGVEELGGRVARYVNRVAEGLQKPLSTHCMLPILASGITDHPWVRNADIVNLQLIHNAQFFSLLNLPGLTRTSRVVLSVHDMFLFTGHCIYSMECERWQTGCGSCPDLDLPFPLRFDTSRLNWKLKNWVFARSRFDLVVGAPWQRERVSRSPMLSRFRLHYIPYGVDTRAYRVLDRQACRRELHIPEDAHAIAFRSVTHSARNFKGTEYIIAALEQYAPPRPTYLLAFEDVGGLEKLRGKYRIIDLGWVMDQGKIAKALNAADVFLMPSIAEGFGLMAVESMACGTPVIVFEGTALPETINAPRSGIAVPYKDSGALARAIGTLLANDGYRAELRQNGLRHVAENHTFDVYADRYLDLYRDLTSSSTSRA